MIFLEAINTVIMGAIPLLIFYFGYRLERRYRREQEEKQKEQDAIEGKHRTRIQFGLEALFFGRQEGFYIAEITMLLHNKGLVRNIIKSLDLEVLGIKEGTKISEFKQKSKKEVLEIKKDTEIKEFEKKSIAEFPIEIVKTIIRHDKGDFFVEPSVVQRFTYVARIPEDIRFILVRSSFKYHDNSEHSAQKVFEVLNSQKQREKLKQ